MDSAFPLSPDFTGDATRAAFPRQLIIYDEKDNLWSATEDEDILANVDYLAVSYRQSDFPDRNDLERNIRIVCQFHQLKAYWLDYACTGASPEEKNRDLYRIADVFRGAKMTLIMISGEDDRPQSDGWLSWGDRIWTLPEALLSQSLIFQVGTRFVKSISLRRVANVAYKDREEEMILIEGYSGKDPLPVTEKVELLRKAIWKRSSGPDKKVLAPGAVMSKGGMFTAYPAERVYALMGFMQYRIIPNQTESEDEAFARLMKANKLERYRFSWDISIQRSLTPLPENDVPDLSAALQSQHLSPTDIPPASKSATDSPESDLSIVIEGRRKALRVIASDGKPQARAQLLCKLALSLGKRFNKTHKMEDINESIECEEETIVLTPDDHVDKPRYRDNLGISYQKRYESTKKIEDLDKAISNKREAVRLVKEDSANKGTYLGNLGWSLQCRYEKTGEMTDLEESVNMNREAVRCSAKDYYDRNRVLTNLATSLYKLYEKKKDFEALDEVVNIRREILGNTTDEQKKQDTITHLSITLHHRFNERGNLSDLNEVIELRTTVVNNASEKDPDKSRYLDNLGLAYRARYDKEKNIDDLNDAIKHREHAVRLTKDKNTKKPKYLNNLAAALTTRYDKLKVTADLEKAIAYRRDAVRLARDNDPEKMRYIDYLEKDMGKR